LAWFASPGCPVPRTQSAAPATNLRVAPNLQSIGCAGGGFSGCPEFRILPRCRFPSSSRLPLRSTSSRSASDEFPGCPRHCISGFTGDGVSSRLESRILRRCRLANSTGCPASSVPRYRRRPVSGLPRILYPPVPADLSPSRLGLRTIRLCQRRISGSPRIFLSPGHTSGINFRVSPALHSSGGANRTNFKVALKLRSVCAVDRPILQVAPASRSFGSTIDASPGCPSSASTVGSMMNPRLYSNFASSACAADESSCPTGPAFPA